MSLRSVANKYHAAANAIAARAERAEKPLTSNQQKGIAFFRDSAAKVEALILPEDSETAEATWSLEVEQTPLAIGGKITAKDKVK